MAHTDAYVHIFLLIVVLCIIFISLYRYVMFFSGISFYVIDE